MSVAHAQGYGRSFKATTAALVGVLASCATYDNLGVNPSRTDLGASGDGNAGVSGLGSTGGEPSLGGAAGYAATGGDAAPAGSGTGAVAGGGAVGGSGATANGGATTSSGGSAGRGATAGSGATTANGGSAGSAGATSNGGTVDNGGTAGSGGIPDVLLSQGKPAAADSEQTVMGLVAGLGNDGSATTRWCAADGAAGHFWTVDLGAVKKLSRLQISWEHVAVYKFKIEGSPDGSAWSMLVDQTTSTNSSPDQSYTLASAPNMRSVRITVTGLPNNNVWASFFEFSVYGH